MDETTEQPRTGVGGGDPDAGPASGPPRARRSDRRRGGRRGSPTAREEPAAPRRGRRSDGRRRRRRRTLTRTTIVVLLLAVVAGAVVVVTTGLVDRARDLVASEPDDDLADLPGDVQPTLAVVTHRDDAPAEQVHHIAVFAHDRATGQGTVLFVPPSTVADVPGHGSFGVGEAFSYGQAPLVGVTLENLLGIRIDEVVGVSEQGWAAALDRVGGYELDVPSGIATGDEGGVTVEAGTQALDGQALAAYLMHRADGETELEVLPRYQRVLQGLLDALGEDPGASAALVGSDGEGDGEGLAGGDPDLVRDLFDGLAQARANDLISMRTLPVSPLGADRTDAYRVDPDRLEELVSSRLAASLPDDEAGAGVSLQILNGVGTPGVGQTVAEVLQPGGYRVLLTGNAAEFDHEITRIVIYDDYDEQLAAARDIRERLGVGEIERSGMPQSVVDVTIIVGADLPLADGAQDRPSAPGREIEDVEDDDADDGA